MIQTGKSKPGGREDLMPWHVAELKERLKAGELFARGYSQWVVTQSGNARLAAQYERAAKLSKAGAGLIGADVLAFDEVIRDALTKKGWMP